MRKLSVAAGIFAVVLVSLVGAEPRDEVAEVMSAVRAEFGMSTVDGTLLVKAGPTDLKSPTVWTFFARDQHRPKELIKLAVTPLDGGWVASSAAAGDLLKRTPPAPLKWDRVRITPAEALGQARQGADLAKAVFEKAEFQLATSQETAGPQWALFLKDANDVEVGFVVVAADTGAVVHQDFTPIPVVDSRPGAPAVAPSSRDPGVEAAQTVKKGARRAWDWTENAGKQTGNFFRELFR